MGFAVKKDEFPYPFHVVFLRVVAVSLQSDSVSQCGDKFFPVSAVVIHDSRSPDAGLVKIHCALQPNLNRPPFSHKTTYTAIPYTAKKPLQSSENLEIHRNVTTLIRFSLHITHFCATFHKELSAIY